MKTIKLCSEEATEQYVMDCVKCGRKFRVIGRTTVMIF